MAKSDIRDPKLAKQGEARMIWAIQDMPVLSDIRKRFTAKKPLTGQRIAACLHVTTETAVLVETLASGGAQVALCASNPLSTQDDVAAYLSQNPNVHAYAIHGVDSDTYYNHIRG